MSPRTRAARAAARATADAPAPAAPEGLRHNDGVLPLLMLMVGLLPAIGAPHEELLQDTLKSMGVAFVALAAALCWVWHRRGQPLVLRWHAVLLGPLALLGYALVSIAWSHPYLAGVEAVRWALFSLLLGLGLQTLGRGPLQRLAWAIHWGAVLAALWAALQFWFDVRWISQGPNPASTFVNRNFFAEYLVCTLPYSVLLLARTQAPLQRLLLAFSTGFNVVALCMAGTRSALLALGLLALLLPWVLWVWRRPLGLLAWPRAQRWAVAGVLLGTVLALGQIPTHNAQLLQDHAREQRGLTPLQRSLARTGSLATAREYQEGSFSVRWRMWQDTTRMVAAHPLAGVGAGAWEVQIPRYQQGDSPLETDFYAHNEFLQLVAEYGLLGWLVGLGLLATLALAGRRTWALRPGAVGTAGDGADPGAGGPSPGLPEGALRAVVLASLLALLVVSLAGFPWRMACTGALFALGLGALGASDARLAAQGTSSRGLGTWRLAPPAAPAALALLLVALALATYLSVQAVRCEDRIVRAVKLALSVSQSAQSLHPRWVPVRAEVMALAREGIAINPHYRKITPLIADELARAGDWPDAVWIWRTVLDSRPHVVALLTNVARGELQMGRLDLAQEHLARALALQPRAGPVRSLQVVLTAQSGREAEAASLARRALADGVQDIDLAQAAYLLGQRQHDPLLALAGLELRLRLWPAQRADTWLRLGLLHASPDLPDAAKALQAFRAALHEAAPGQREALREQVPEPYRSRL